MIVNVPVSDAEEPATTTVHTCNVAPQHNAFEENDVDPVPKLKQPMSD
ncbi:hypothetical protein [Desertimonas flava]|nr:hypothetical protein [Desertimonas flava]